MSVVTSRTFTLGDLAKIALGASELTSEHLSVLQSLLVILLQKLDGHNEIVRIHGFPAKCVQKLIKDNPSHCQYNFQLKNFKGFQEKYELLAELERKAQEIDSKMFQHFEQIRCCHKSKAFDAPNWDFYASPTEDLCTLYMKHNKDFCLLARNSVFNIEIHRRIVPLMVERFTEFETKIENMQSRLEEITQVSKKAAAKLKNIEFMVNDIGKIRSSLDTWSKNFCETMLEVQEMMDCKLHRVVLPALQIYLEPRFFDIKQRLEVLSTVSNICPSTKPLAIKDKKTCLSCSHHYDFKFFKKLQTLKSIDDENKCCCSGLLKEKSVLTKINGIQTSDLPPLPPSSFRERSTKKVYISLQSQGIITKYGSFSKIPLYETNVPVMNTKSKKQPIKFGTYDGTI